jgi:hypothetical protein
MNPFMFRNYVTVYGIVRRNAFIPEGYVAVRWSNQMISLRVMP